MFAADSRKFSLFTSFHSVAPDHPVPSLSGGKSTVSVRSAASLSSAVRSWSGDWRAPESVQAGAIVLQVF